MKKWTFSLIFAVIFLPQIANHAEPLTAMRLSFTPLVASQPTLAADGKLLLYVGEENGQPEIYSQQLANGRINNLSQTTTAQEETPLFSPDGATIAFASNRSGDWDIFLMDATGGNLRLGIGHGGSDEQHPAFFPDGQHIAFVSNHANGQWDIYTATLTNALNSTLWTRLTTSPANERFPSLSANGATLAFRRELTQSGQVNSELFVMDIASGFEQQVTTMPAFDGYPVLTPDGSGLVFTSDRASPLNVYSMNLAGAGLAALNKPTNWFWQTPRWDAQGQALLFAGGPTGMRSAIYTQAQHSPLQQVAARGFANLGSNCDWDGGVLAYGWVKVARFTQQPQTMAWVRQWVDQCLASNQMIDHVNDGLLGYAAIVAYEQTHETRYLTLAQQIADYLLQTAQRTADGTLGHIGLTVWPDTLISVIPFLMEMGRITQRPLYWDEAAAQMVKHAQHLQNAQTKLYRHAWDAETDTFLGPSYWCRGNSWSMIAAVEILSQLPTQHAQRATILASFQQQAAALKPWQNASGLWPTVVNQPTFYLESSGSAMIAAALLQGVAEKWLEPADFAVTAQQARFALWRQVHADGTVSGVSAPTGPMGDESAYNRIPISTSELYGQGALLLMGSVNNFGSTRQSVLARRAMLS